MAQDKYFWAREHDNKELLRLLGWRETGEEQSLG
jgi:hypothetical protein